LIIGWFYGNPAVETLISTFETGKYLLNENWKYAIVHFLVVAIYCVLFLHAFAALLIVSIYWDQTDRMLKFSCDALLQLQAQFIAKCYDMNKTEKKQIFNTRLANICQKFEHQKIITANMAKMIQTFVDIYITIVLPFLIILIYIIFKLSPHLNWPIFLCVFIFLIFWSILWANVYTCSSSLFEHSNRFVINGQKIGHVLQTSFPYWRVKFRSLRPIKIGASGCYFSKAKLLPTFSQFVHKTIKLLLL